MHIQKIYLDTSVIGGCFDDEFLKWSNGLIEDFKKNIFIPVISEVVETELKDAPSNVKEIYNILRNLNCIVLEITDEALELATIYQERKILTPKYFDDGLHIALATINKIDLLVSWNFKHIVHFDKIRLFNAVNIEYGYKSIEIYSPREVTTVEKD
ncbi:MAG: type II toxin-antitoxin system VapC family toxin [Spirochaetes bacterium]|nr:type II toxin-antitoxin system VapC family toxin [Spirochaetota bacterium]MCK5032856.1 type II toxin-antitoxin system VapC family toxin [Calditrichia bacterium]